MRFIERIGNQIPYVKGFLKKRSYDKRLDLRKLPQDELVNLLMDKYEKKMGYRMDINNPVTFTEKVQWYKVFYTRDKDGEELIRMVDKYLFKDYIKEKLGDGYTIPLYGVYNSFEELKKGWKALPEEFVLKSTLSDEGKNIKFVHRKSEVSLSSIKKEMSNCFKDKLLLCNSFCKAYQSGVPRIIAEQYLENIKDQLFDYKMFCFDGEPFCMYVATEHFNKDNYPITFYDLEWNKIDVQYGIHLTSEVACPPHFDEMKRIAAKLSEGFPFLRVDFFDTKEKLYLAELTLYPGGGYSPYTPQSFNEKMGGLFKLPIDS